MPTYYVLPQNKVLFSRTATGSCIFTIYLSEVHGSNLTFNISYTSVLGSPLGIIGSTVVINSGQLTGTFTVTASSIDTYYINVACGSIEPYSFECVLSNLTVGEEGIVGIRDWIGEITEETFNSVVGIRDWVGEVTEETFDPVVSITGFTPSEISFGSIPPTGWPSESVGVLNTSLELANLETVGINTSLNLLSGFYLPTGLTLKEDSSGRVDTSLYLSIAEPPSTVQTSLTLSHPITLNCMGVVVFVEKGGIHLSNSPSRFRGRRETIKLVPNIKTVAYQVYKKQEETMKMVNKIECSCDYYSGIKMEMLRKIQRSRFQVSWRI